MGWIRETFNGIWHAVAGLFAGRTLVVIVAILCAVLAIGLMIASRRRLVQTKPITVAIVLSILAHIWLLFYASGIRDRLPPGNPRGNAPPMAMAFGIAEDVPPPASDDSQQDNNSTDDSAKTIAVPAWEQSPTFDQLPLAIDVAELLSEQPVEPELKPLLEPAPLPPLPALLELSQAESATVELQPTLAEAVLPAETASNLNEPSFRDSPAELAPVLPDASLVQSRQHAAEPFPTQSERLQAELTHADRSPVLPAERQLPQDSVAPREYQLRQAHNRLQLVQPFGADESTEQAVEAALAWLAQAQANDGSWIAAMYGAGTETMALGEYRHGTGGRADTGVSGLALLAFLSAGHTHRDGEYRAVVAQGLNYLLGAQMPSGDLSGAKQVGNDPSVVYARMYCHSIAALALAEAYAMTRDPALLAGLSKATQYSLKAQDVRGGGWRYRPGDAGDLSQFGWQAMVLRSSQHSGIDISTDVQRRMRTFLDSCAAGENGGLARYLPREGRPSATMTAEALACRLLLDYPLNASAQVEAERMLLQHLPGSEPDNVYFWYYATLALFQLQDDSWRTWNEALKGRLVATQHGPNQPQAGSWDPDSIWGGYGGRVYSTALSCLCLEVYYRYLPMYQRSQLARQNAEGLNR